MNIKVVTILNFFFFFNFFMILIEFLFSKYKKDFIYATDITVNNVLNGIVLNLFSPKFYAFYFILLSQIYNFFHIDLSLQFNWVTFILCLLFVDFMYYVFHRLHHSVLFFWSLHSVHHSDTKLNLSTAMRISWFEQIYLFFFFTPVVLAGFHPLLIFLAFYVLVTYQFYCHSQYIRLPKALEYILVTPSNHRVHHDQEHIHQTSNFGGVFSMWDRLLDTYAEPETMTNFSPGVKNFKENNFLKYQIIPIVKYIKSIRKKEQI